jgi:NADH:ubiquinone oxidoreductase subunit E
MFEVDFKPGRAPLFNLRICINRRLNTDNLPNCAGRGSRELADRLERLIDGEGLRVKVLRGPCMNNYAHGPNMKLQGADYFSLENDVSDARVAEIMAAVRRETARRDAAGAPPAATP